MNRETKIEYRFFTRDDEERQIKEVIGGLTWLFPHWLQHICIDRYESSGKKDDESTASVKSKVEYRSATLYIYDRWATASDESRVRSLIHELIHVRHAEVLNFVNSELLILAENESEKLHGALSREFKRCVEGFTEDFAYIIYDLIDRNSNKKEG